MVQPCARSAAKFDFYTDHDLIVDDLRPAPGLPLGVRVPVVDSRVIERKEDKLKELLAAMGATDVS